MQNLGQMSASNMSSALSSIMGEVNPSTSNVSAVLNVAPTNIIQTNVVAPTNINIPTNSNKNIPTSVTSQQKNTYSNVNSNYAGETHYPSTNHATGKSPKNVTTTSKPGLFRHAEDKERPESAYSNLDKKRTTNNVMNNPDENIYSSKKYIPTGQMTGSQLSNHSGLNQASGSNLITSNKYNLPSYPINSKATSHEGKYQVGLSKNTHESSGTASGLNKPNKYGVLNLGLNRPGGMFKGSKE